MTKTAGEARSWPTRVRLSRVVPEREVPDGPRVRDWHSVVAASIAQDAPGTTPVTPERFHACLTAGTTIVWTATRGTRVLGLAVLRLPSTTSTGRAQVHVHPNHRRRGVGDRLMRALIDEAHARGLYSVIVAVPTGGTGDALCQKRGLTRLRTLHHLLLSLREMHPGWLDEMVAAEHPGYRLTETVRIARPGRDAMVSLDTVPPEAAPEPTPEAAPEPTPEPSRDGVSDGTSPDGTRPDGTPSDGVPADAVPPGAVPPNAVPSGTVPSDAVAAETLPGDVLLTVAAEHGRKVVGCTEVVVPGGSERRVTQHDHPPADGHHDLGLDLWVKAAMLRLLYDQYPQVTQVATDNPEGDTALLDVNRHLGFRLHHRTNEYRLEITGPPATDRPRDEARTPHAQGD
ncbi:GNAT family N-acetyltransferase [Actinomadura barringtoniae]|uniref:GNAT family N-acetyltransferase n=1 Tax=Actinomadura barringtoniae TaxID=1427535 RepID=A0A939PJQ5_9ACTN|nr:GNAT family N-acetyltransferase [Actinomadura barringtoniae]MBO2454167.1 GNAT family N-acetyltransferase [Actinomadura barringtoniae]